MMSGGLQFWKKKRRKIMSLRAASNNFICFKSSILLLAKYFIDLIWSSFIGECVCVTCKLYISLS